MASKLSGLADSGSAVAADSVADELRLEQFITYRLTALSNMLNRQMERFLNQRFDISLPDWRVLANLGHFQDMSVRDLAARSRMDKALVSRAVARLVKRGFVSSRPDTRDGRLVVLALTESGREMYEAIMPLARKRQRRLLECLNDKERTTFEQALDKLIAIANDNEQRKSEVSEPWWN